MIVRLTSFIVIASVVTLGLLLAMQLMIETGRAALTETHAFRVVGFVRIARSERIATRRAAAPAAARDAAREAGAGAGRELRH